VVTLVSIFYMNDYFDYINTTIDYLTDVNFHVLRLIYISKSTSS